MKGSSIKIATVGALTLALLVSTSVVSADATTTQDRQGRREIRQNGQQERKDIRGEGRAVRAGIASSTREGVRDIRHSSSTPEAKRGEIEKLRGEKRDELRANGSSTRSELRDSREKTLGALKENGDKLKTDIKARRDALQAKMKADKKAKKEKLSKDKQARVLENVNNVYAKLSDRVKSLTEADAKIADKIAKLNATGVSTTAVQDLLLTAQTALTTAKVDIEATKSLVTDQATASSTSKDQINSLIQKAQASMKTAGEAYKKTLDALKPLARPTTSTATTTSN